MLTVKLIAEARERIATHIHRTPVITSRIFNEATGKQVFFKCENLQRAGAFKIRGATNRIRALTDEEKRRGVVAFSSGNHAQAVALAGREAGVRAVVAMPSDAPKAKVAGTRGYGAEIAFYDRQKEDREAVARQIGERDGLVLVPPYETGDDTRQSLIKGERVTIPPPPTIADGLRVQVPGTLTFPILRQNAEDVLTVADQEIIDTLRFILFHMKMLVEPSGVAAAAAVFTGKLPQDTKRVGVVLSGGNIDAEFLAVLLR